MTTTAKKEVQIFFSAPYAVIADKQTAEFLKQFKCTSIKVRDRVKKYLAENNMVPSESSQAMLPWLKEGRQA